MDSNSFSRKKIAIRLLYTIFFLIVFEILKIIIQVAVLFQYIYLFITKDFNKPIREFSNKVSVYAYRVMRYITLSENEKPFPFQDFPQEMEMPETEVLFN